MNLTHNGKIGHLPGALQGQLNRRLHNGEKSPSLIAWLNALPEVQSILAAEFDGKPIRKQNLSQWRKRGYKLWLRHHEAQSLATQIGNLQPTPGDPPLTGQMTTWLSVQYLMAVRNLVDCRARREGCPPDSPDDSHLKVLREFCLDLVALRRNELGEARLKFEQERLELRLQKLPAHSQANSAQRVPAYGGSSKTTAAKREPDSASSSDTLAPIGGEGWGEGERAILLPALSVKASWHLRPGGNPD